MNMGNGWQSRLAGLSLRWTRKSMTIAIMAVLFAVALAVSGVGGRKVVKGGAVGQNEEQTAAQVSSADAVDVTDAQPEGKDSGARSDETAQPEAANAHEVLRFDGALKGLQVETDENGELVGSERDGALWYKITDSRFSSYRQYSRVVKRTMSGDQANDFLTRVDRYLVTQDDGLYFVIGESGRTVETGKRYVLDRGTRIRVSAIHTPEASKRYGISRSNADFVKSDGVWKLTALTVF